MNTEDEVEVLPASNCVRWCDQENFHILPIHKKFRTLFIFRSYWHFRSPSCSHTSASHRSLSQWRMLGRLESTRLGWPRANVPGVLVRAGSKMKSLTLRYDILASNCCATIAKHFGCRSRKSREQSYRTARRPSENVQEIQSSG